MKKTLLFAGAVIAALFTNYIITVVDQPLHYRLASDVSIKGKGKDGDCAYYASALSSKLAANDIHGRLIFYRWRIRETGVSGSHVLVCYHLSDGTYWIADNERPHPKQVSPDESLMDLVYELTDNHGRNEVEVELQEGLNKLSFF